MKIEDYKMQLDEQIQQHIISLPIELKTEVLDFVLYLEQKRARQAKNGHTPTTQKFIGLLAGSNLDESDYKKHLEEKYL